MGKRLTMFTDSIYVFDSEVSSDVMVGEEVILSVTDLDALWMGTNGLLWLNNTANYQPEVQQLHDTYGLAAEVAEPGLGGTHHCGAGVSHLGYHLAVPPVEIQHHPQMLRTIKSVSIKNYTFA